jgi:hypothetical protein
MRVTMKTTSSRARQPIWRAEEHGTAGFSASNRRMHRVDCMIDGPSGISSEKALVEQRECHSLNRLGNKYKQGYLQMCIRIAKFCVCRASSIKPKSIESMREEQSERPKKNRSIRKKKGPSQL